MSKAFLYVIGACATAIFSNFVQADFKQDYAEYSKSICIDGLTECRHKLSEGYYGEILAMSTDEMAALCDGKPRNNRPTKCMMACEMQLKGWMDERGLFQPSGFIKYMEGLPHKGGVKYWKAVEKAAKTCYEKDLGEFDECKSADTYIKCLDDEGKKYGYDGLGLHYLTYVVTVYI